MSKMLDTLLDDFRTLKGQKPFSISAGECRSIVREIDLLRKKLKTALKRAEAVRRWYCEHLGFNEALTRLEEAVGTLPSDGDPYLLRYVKHVLKERRSA